MLETIKDIVMKVTLVLWGIVLIAMTLLGFTFIIIGLIDSRVGIAGVFVGGIFFMFGMSFGTLLLEVVA